jgi:hypothetical protein
MDDAKALSQHLNKCVAKYKYLPPALFTEAISQEIETVRYSFISADYLMQKEAAVGGILEVLSRPVSEDIKVLLKSKSGAVVTSALNGYYDLVLRRLPDEGNIKAEFAATKDTRETCWYLRLTL